MKKLLFSLILCLVISIGVKAQLNSLGSYVWNASDEPKIFNYKLQLSFVSSSQGFPQYGTVLAGGGYSTSQDGGVFQMYFPYSESYGGKAPKIRLGKYNNQGWSNWETFYTSINANLSTVDWTGKNIIAHGNIGIGITNPQSYFHIKNNDGSANYPSLTSRGDILQFYEVVNNSLEIGVAGASNSRLSWILSRHSDINGTYGKYYSTLHLQPDIGDKSQYRGIAIGYSPSTHVNVGTHLAVNGNVGIGTTSPLYKFEVEHSAATNDTEYLIGAFNNSTNTGGVYLGYVGDGTDAKEARVRAGGFVDLALGTTSQKQAIYIKNSNGNIGIGTANPSVKLEIVNGSLYVHGSSGGEGRIVMQLDGYNQYEWYPHQNGLFLYDRTSQNYRFSIHNDGNVGIGTTTPNGKLNIYNPLNFNSDMAASGQDHIIMKATDPGNGGYFGGITWESGGRRRASIVATREHDDTDHVGIAFFTRGTDGAGPMYESMRIKRNGYVGIGTSNPQSLLAVNGIITSKEVNVTLDSWSDFVFDQDYELSSLSEIENYIIANKHLPGIPTENEVKENGINLGEMNAKLLQKIEELTLYMIDINKRMNSLETENSELKEKIEKFGITE